MESIDFKGLGDELLQNAETLLPQWLPGGKKSGSEFKVGSLGGEKGSSLSINTNTGVWQDFATGDNGGDLISLYAAIHQKTQVEAAKALINGSGRHMVANANGNGGKPKEKKKYKAPEYQLEEPPEDQQQPVNFDHFKLGKPVSVCVYRNETGYPMFYKARYDSPEGKTFMPWSWCARRFKWVNKDWPAPRPLMGLDQLSKFPDKMVLLVEGEKACVAARKIVGDKYVVVTWANGSKAIKKTDWTPLHGRKIRIWPDADKPGVDAADQIMTILKPHCNDGKIFTVSDFSGGWDAADALAEGWDWEKFKSWGLENVVVWAGELPADPGVPSVPEAVVETQDPDGPGDGTVMVTDSNVQVNILNSPDNDDVPDSVVALWHKYNLTTTSQGNPHCNLDNLMRLFSGSSAFKNLIWWDEFHLKYFTSVNGKVRPWDTMDDYLLTARLQRQFGMSRLTDDVVRKARLMFGHYHKKNAPKSWMESLVWDGEERVKYFFPIFYGCEENEYTRAVSKNFWVGMIARVFRPGCQLDTMVVLEGKQGVYKTQSLQAIVGPDLFATINTTVEKKDFYLDIQGKLLLELGELGAITGRKVQTEKIKNALSCQNDRFRPPYAAESSDHPRQCIFVGTTNRDDWNIDETGARRFWPIKVGDNEVEIQLIRKHREQLFAEAVALFKKGENWWEVPGEFARQEQEARRQSDVWEDIIKEYLIGQAEVTTTQVAEKALDIPAAKLDPVTQRRIGAALKLAGWSKKNRRRNGTQMWVWREDWSNE